MRSGTHTCTHRATRAELRKGQRGSGRGSRQRHVRALGTAVGFVRDANGTAALTFHNPLSVKQTLEHFSLKPDDAWDVLFTAQEGEVEGHESPVVAAELGAGCVNSSLQGVSRNTHPNSTLLSAHTRRDGTEGPSWPALSDGGAGNSGHQSCGAVTPSGPAAAWFSAPDF